MNAPNVHMLLEALTSVDRSIAIASEKRKARKLIWAKANSEAEAMRKRITDMELRYQTNESLPTPLEELTTRKPCKTYSRAEFKMLIDQLQEDYNGRKMNVKVEKKELIIDIKFRMDERIKEVLHYDAFIAFINPYLDHTIWQKMLEGKTYVLTC